MTWPSCFTALPFGYVLGSLQHSNLSSGDCPCAWQTVQMFKRTTPSCSFSFFCTFSHQPGFLPGNKGMNYFPPSDKCFIKVFMRKRVKWLDYWIIGGLSKSWDFINPSLLWEVFRILSLVIMSLKMSSKAIPFNISLRIRENAKELFNHLIFLLEFIDASAFIPFEFKIQKAGKETLGSLIWKLWYFLLFLSHFTFVVKNNNNNKYRKTFVSFHWYKYSKDAFHIYSLWQVAAEERTVLSATALLCIGSGSLWQQGSGLIHFLFSFGGFCMLSFE